MPTHIEQGVAYTLHVGVDDGIPEVAARFIGRHKLSKTLLPNVEKELHVTQCELFRRSVMPDATLDWARSRVDIFVAMPPPKHPMYTHPMYPVPHNPVHHLLPERL